MTTLLDLITIIAWPSAAVVVSVLAYKVAQKFVPAKEDKVFQKLDEFEKMLSEQQTEISKLNVMFGIGQTQKNRENLIQGLTGMKIGSK